jgi:RNA polymerase sigma-70 factor (ECF subfamily)
MAGDLTAFNALCRLHSPRLFRTVRQITRKHEDAEDALQDAFMRAFVHLKSFDGRAQFATWLTKIALNSALMILRKRKTDGTGVHVTLPLLLSESRDYLVILGGTVAL